MRRLLFLALALASLLPPPAQAQDAPDKLSLEALTAPSPGGEGHRGYARPAYARHAYSRHAYARRSPSSYRHARRGSYRRGGHVSHPAIHRFHRRR